MAANDTYKCPVLRAKYNVGLILRGYRHIMQPANWAGFPLPVFPRRGGGSGGGCLDTAWIAGPSPGKVIREDFFRGQGSRKPFPVESILYEDTMDYEIYF
jgi:hypothetical protein